MEKLFVKMENLATDVQDYVQNRITYTKLNLADKSSLLVSRLVALLVIGMLSGFILLFGSASAALALSAWIGKAYSGFLLVAGFYLLLGIFIWIFREKLLRIPVMNSIIQALFKEEHHEKNESPVRP